MCNGSVRDSFLTLLALSLVTVAAVPVAAAQSSPDFLTTQSNTITIWVRCEEGVVNCDDVEYLWVNRRTGASIKLKGEDWIRYCADDQGDGLGKTPCQHLGYRFRSGGATYYVGDDGYLEVYQSGQRVLHETGEWNW